MNVGNELKLYSIQESLQSRIKGLQEQLRKKVHQKGELEKELDGIQMDISSIQSNLSDAMELLELTDLIAEKEQGGLLAHKERIKEPVEEIAKLVGLSKGDAALDILRRQGKPLTTAQILEKLKLTGIRFGENEYNIMYTALKRKEKLGKVERLKDKHSNEVKWLLIDYNK